MATVESQYTVTKSAVFKGLFVAVFVADATAALPTELFDADGNLNTLPPGWYPVGYLTEDGMTHSRERDIAETMAAQEAASIRDDVQADTSTSQIVMLETSPVAIALYEGLLFTQLGTQLGTPLSWAKPAVPKVINRRFLFVAVDYSKTTGAEKIRARLYPSGAVTEIGDETENRSDAKGYECTVKAYKDVQAGTDVLHWMDGPGWRELATPAATSVTVAPATVSVAEAATTQLSATLTYTDTSTTDVTSAAAWSSSDETVALVSAGEVTGVGAGTATVTATHTGLSGTCEVTVTSM
ncbi:Ig-like domain-containing protein [Nocardiopsis sp. LOL_012]|uniref:Ig-like domain-containing protein n=1 Tax=Nocardiopsis sp. LOL_012 TaxID=3345409 RepID=UPI003A841C97